MASGWGTLIMGEKFNFSRQKIYYPFQSLKSQIINAIIGKIVLEPYQVISGFKDKFRAVRAPSPDSYFTL